jgi:hypothetical protein
MGPTLERDERDGAPAVPQGRKTYSRPTRRRESRCAPSCSRRVKEDELRCSSRRAGDDRPKRPEDGLDVGAGCGLLSCLDDQDAFIIGFLIFIPFLVSTSS